MKTIFNFLIALTLLLSTSLLAQISKAEIVATGLTCSMCSNAINKQLKKLPEVEKIDTDLNSNTFVVFLKKDNKIEPKILKETIEKAGFFVGSMIVSFEFNNLKIQENTFFNNDNYRLFFVNSKPQILSGTIRLKFLDKGYTTQKEQKKLLKSLENYSSFNNKKPNDYYVTVL